MLVVEGADDVAVVVETVVGRFPFRLRPRDHLEGRWRCPVWERIGRTEAFIVSGRHAVAVATARESVRLSTWRVCGLLDELQHVGSVLVRSAGPVGETGRRRRRVALIVVHRMCDLVRTRSVRNVARLHRRRHG